MSLQEERKKVGLTSGRLNPELLVGIHDYCCIQAISVSGFILKVSLLKRVRSTSAPLKQLC